MLMVAVKATVAVTERPRPMFDALHDSGEAREVAERTRTEVAFFVEAVERVRRAAIIWVFAVVQGVRPEFAEAIEGVTNIAGRSFSEGYRGIPKWNSDHGMSLQCSGSVYRKS